MTRLDIDRLAEITRGAIAARRTGSTSEEAFGPSRGASEDTGGLAPPAGGVPSAGAAPSREELDRLGWHRFPARPLPRTSHRSGLGPFVSFTKRAVHRALRPFIVDVLARQEQFNEAAVAALHSVAADSAHRAERDEEIWAELRTVRVLLDRLANEATVARRAGTDPDLERAVEGLRAAVVRRAEDPEDSPGAPVTPPSEEEAERYRKFHEGASVFETTLDIYRQYVPHFLDCRRVLDLACGRGPFLTLLQEAGVPAYGVDFNPAFVEEVAGRGLEAVQGEAITHLETLEPRSLDGVFTGHLVEHLAPEALLRLFLEVHRVLSDDGVFVVESPNTADLGVLAGAYFRDVTHRMPRHPDTYRFLARAAGFVSVDLGHSYPLETDERMREVPVAAALDDNVRFALNANFGRLNELLFGPRNFSLVCRKWSRES